MTKLFNAFSIQMLPTGNETVIFKKINCDCIAREMFAGGVDSYIGHKETANILSEIIGSKVEAQRRYGKIEYGEKVVIAQVVGGRLPEGATTLPEGARIEFFTAEIV